MNNFEATTRTIHAHHESFVLADRPSVIPGKRQPKQQAKPVFKRDTGNKYKIIGQDRVTLDYLVANPNGDLCREFPSHDAAMFYCMAENQKIGQ